MAAKKELNIVDLEKIIADRQTQVETLLRKRDELEQKIADIDADMQRFLKTGRLRRRKPKNEVPLRTVVLEALSKSKKGLSLSEVTAKVKASGYKSHAQNFKLVVYQCLYNTANIVHDDATGLYRVKR